ncbi:hypothetical protein R6Q59_035763 [Mikania micrantha]
MAIRSGSSSIRGSMLKFLKIMQNKMAKSKSLNERNNPRGKNSSPRFFSLKTLRPLSRTTNGHHPRPPLNITVSFNLRPPRNTTVAVSKASQPLVFGFHGRRPSATGSRPSSRLMARYKLGMSKKPKNRTETELTEKPNRNQINRKNRTETDLTEKNRNRILRQCKLHHGDSTNTNGTAPPPIDPAGNMEMDSSIASPISEGNMSEPMVLDVKGMIINGQMGYQPINPIGLSFADKLKVYIEFKNRGLVIVLKLMLMLCKMFFFFFESWGHKTDPVVIWFTGGPGCSSELALFYKNGPFKIEKNSSLVWNEYGWDQMYGDLLINQYMASLVNCLGTGGREMSKSEALRLLRGYIKVNNLENGRWLQVEVPSHEAKVGQQV